MRILITNPPWIFRENFLVKRSGVRAGSRWPFSGRIPGAPAYLMHLFEVAREKSFLDTAKHAFKYLLKSTKKNSSCDLSLPFPSYVPYPGFMGYTTNYLRSKGIEAIFYDAIAQQHDCKAFFKKVDEIKPDIVIQETSTPSFDIDLKITKKLHEKYEVCLVGPHATAFAENLIKLPFIDYILKGAYEHSSWEMVQTRRRGIYEHAKPMNLDDLPYPYRDEVIIHHYRDTNCRKKFAIPQLWVYASRGCAFQCSFCLWQHTMFNKKLALRKPENILGEIDNEIKRFGFKHIYFDDDCWNLGSEERMMKIADGMKEIALPWTINARFDGCSRETFKYLADRGCVGLRLGIESLSQGLLDRINKRLKVQNILDAINYLERLDLDLYLLFMHYLPGENEQDRCEQNQKIKELNHRYQNPPCIPFPGTPYYNKLVESGRNPMDSGVQWHEYDGGKIGDNLKRIVKEYSQTLSHPD